MLIDTHTHIYLKEFDQDRSDMIKRAVAAGVKEFYLPNIDSSSISSMLNLEKEYPNQCFPMMGLHPCSVKENYENELVIIENWLKERPFSAVGEIGIDLYWDKSTVEAQKKAFVRQIEWAKELRRPIVIHSRDSLDMTIKIVSEHKDERLTGIFHCFGGTLDQARKIMDLEFYMGIGGV